MSEIILELAILEIYPDAQPMRDFIIAADNDTQEQYIESWKTDKFAKPTNEQIQAAWLIAKEKNNTPEPTVEERLKAIEETNASITMEMVMKDIALGEANKKISALDSFNADLLMTLIEKEVI